MRKVNDKESVKNQINKKIESLRKMADAPFSEKLNNEEKYKKWLRKKDVAEKFLQEAEVVLE